MKSTNSSYFVIGIFQMTFIEPLKRLRRTLGVRSNPG